MDHSVIPVDLFPKRTLSRKDGPLYQQVVDIIRHLIASGRLDVGSDLPKEAEIEELLGVSLITVRRALRELEELGMVQKRSAKPAKVTARAPTVRSGHRFHTYKDLTEFTRNARIVVRSYGKEKGALIEKYFGLTKGEHGYCLRGHLAVDDQPRTMFTTFFPPDIGSQMSIGDFTDVLIFRNVMRCTGVRITRVLITARADLANETQARELGIKTGSPLMSKEMVYLSDKLRTVEVTITNIPSDQFVLSYDISLEDVDDATSGPR